MSNNRRIVNNSLLKSSISIKSIQNSVTKFSAGILRARSSAGQIAEITNENNKFKQTLIGRDNEFFRKRREGVARKVREDELEATTVGGVLRRQGTLVAKSTRGFLGRILDFIGVLLLGWLINTLPAIIKMVGELIKKMRQLVNILTGFVEGIKDVLTGIGGILDGFLGRFKREDFDKSKNDFDEGLSKAEQGFNLLNKELVEGMLPLQDKANYGLTDDDVADVEDEAENLRKERSGEEQDEEQDEEQEQEQGQEQGKPQGIMRGLAGVTDFFTANMFDLDKRGGIFGGGEQQQQEEEQKVDPNDNFVQRQPSFIKTEAQRNAEIEAEGDEEFNKKMDGLQIEGISPNVSTIEQAKDIDELRQGMETEDVKTNQDVDKPNEEEKFNKGGKVEGKPGIDQVLAKLTSGEFIMTKETTERIGSNFLDMLNKGGEIEQMIKPKDDMIESIQTQLLDKTEAIANLTRERVGSTVIMMDTRQTNVNPPPPPVSGGSKGGISIIETNPLSKLHHILHRFT